MKNTLSDDEWEKNALMNYCMKVGVKAQGGGAAWESFK